MKKDLSTTVSGSSAAGDIAGRDIVHNEIFQATQRSALREIAEKLRLQVESDQHLKTFIDELQHFISKAPDVPSRDLETKLHAASRGDVVPQALALKERFTKKLVRLQFSAQAQELFAHVLSRIHAFFTYRVQPKASEHVPRSQIDEMIYKDLLEPIYNEIGSCEAGIDLADLQGMMYFLGGNCHIRWD